MEKYNLKIYGLIAILGFGAVIVRINWGLVMGPRRTLVSTGQPLARPHIIFILADDLGWNDVGFHNSEIRTPNIDALARDGVTLDRYYVQPTCSPSRSQLMSGRYQIHTGLQHLYIEPGQPNGLPLNTPTLPELLRKQGYATHIVGKWHLGFYKKAYTPTYRGFDSHLGYWTDSEDYYSHVHCDVYNGSNRCGLDFRDNMELSRAYEGQYSTHVFTQRAEHIIDNHVKSQTERPLFLYLPFQAVNPPPQVPAEYEKPYESTISNKARRAYAGVTSCLDEAVGNITRSLKRNGIWKDTILVFSTDNGGAVKQGASNWPLRGKRGDLWDGGIRGVGFVHGKGVKSSKGQKLKELIHISDWLPTLVTLAGGDVSQLALDGVNAWPSISDGKPSSRIELLHNIDPLTPMVGQRLTASPFDNRVRAAMQYGRWKLLTGNPGQGKLYPRPTELGEVKTIPSQLDQNIWLFDIRADPSEEHDLSAERANVVMDMLHKLAKYNSSAVPCHYPPQDPNSDPSRHGDAWIPWMDA